MIPWPLLSHPSVLCERGLPFQGHQRSSDSQWKLLHPYLACSVAVLGTSVQLLLIETSISCFPPPPGSFFSVSSKAPLSHSCSPSSSRWTVSLCPWLPSSLDFSTAAASYVILNNFVVKVPKALLKVHVPNQVHLIYFSNLPSVCSFCPTTGSTVHYLSKTLGSRPWFLPPSHLWALNGHQDLSALPSNSALESGHHPTVRLLVQATLFLM